MDLYELIKDYGDNMDKETMWKVVKRVSDYIEPMEETDAEGYWGLIKETYADMKGGHFNKCFADWQIKEMYYTDKKGEKHYAPYWTESEMASVYDDIKPLLHSKEYNVYDFMVTLNMIKSDNALMYETWWKDATDMDLNPKYVDAAVNYLNDVDSPYGTEKIWRYFNK